MGCSVCVAGRAEALVFRATEGAEEAELNWVKAALNQGRELRFGVSAIEQELLWHHHVEQIPDTAVLFQRMAQVGRCIQRIVVLAADSLAFQKLLCFQLGYNALHSTLSNPDR